MKFRWLYASTFTVLLAACATTDPESAASIDYKLPKTNLTLTMTLLLTSCPPSGSTGGNQLIGVDADIILIAKPGAQKDIYRIEGRQLASSKIKRDLTIELSDNGVISAINTTNTDRTPAIIGNLVSSVVSIAGLGILSISDRQNTSFLQCRSDIEKSLKQIDKLKTEIVDLRVKLANSSRKVKVAELVETINALAIEIARIRLNDLSVKLVTELDLGPGPSVAGSRVLFDYSPIKESWFVVPKDAKSDPKPLTDNELDHYFMLNWSAKPASQTINIAVNENSVKLSSCDFSVKVPGIETVQVKVGYPGESLRDFKGIERSIPVAQWKLPEELCLSVGFGEKRTTNLMFDKFGRKKKLVWSSEARLEGATAGLVGVGKGLSELKNAFQGPSDLAEQKSEIDRLTTLQDYNRLKACQLILEAGGSKCPP